MNIRHPPRRPPRTAKTAEALSEEQVLREAEFKDKGRGKGCQGRGGVEGVARTLLSAAFDFDFDLTLPVMFSAYQPLPLPHERDARAHIDLCGYHGRNFQSDMKNPAPSRRAARSAILLRPYCGISAAFSLSSAALEVLRHFSEPRRGDALPGCQQAFVSRGLPRKSQPGASSFVDFAAEHLEQAWHVRAVFCAFHRLLQARSSAGLLSNG